MVPFLENMKEGCKLEKEDSFVLKAMHLNQPTVH